MSTINSDPITDIAVPEFQSAILILAMVIYGILVVSGVLFVTVFVIVLFRGRSTFKEIPFFTIVSQLTFCNFLGIYIQAFCKFPLLFFDTNDENSLEYQWELMGTRVIYFSDTGFTFFVLLMALNRFAVFVVPKALCLFSKCKVWYPIGVTWVLIVLSTLVKIFWGGVEKFDRRNWSITLLLAKPDGDILLTIVSCQDYAVSVLLLVIYVSIYYAIRKNREAHGVEDKDDTSLLKQASVVAVSLIVFRILSNVSGAIRASVYITWMLNILRFSSSVCNNMLNPILFLNTKSVRKILKEMLHCGTPGSREETNGSENTKNNTSKGSCLPFYRVRPAEESLEPPPRNLASQTNSNNAVTPID